MNQNKKRTRYIPRHRGLVITYSKEGTTVNQSTDLPTLLNTTLRGLLTIAEAQSPTQEAKDETFKLISTGFQNFLTVFSPENMFPAKEDLQQEIEDDAKRLQAMVDMGMGSNIDFDKLKEQQLPKIEEARKYQEEHPEDVLDLTPALVTDATQEQE